MHTSAGKFMLGSLLMGTVYALTQEYKDDKDPYFDLIGNIPNTPAGETLKRSGAKNWSLKVGSTYWRFSETPFVLSLGPLAALRDLERAKGKGALARASTYEKISMSLAASAQSFMDKGFLKGLGGILDNIAHPNKSNFLDTVFLNPIKGFIPGAALLRAASRWTDNPVDTTYNDFWSKLISGIPFAQSYGTRPALNYFAKPLEKSIPDRLSFLGRFYSDRVDDPSWRWLAANDYHVGDTGTTVSFPEKSYPNAAKRRTLTMGEAFAGVLNPEEQYKYTQTAGPLREQKVLEYARKYGGSGHQKSVQDKLLSDLADINSRVKYDLFVRNAH
jgi:hypothetical protein